MLLGKGRGREGGVLQRGVEIANEIAIAEEIVKED